MTGRTPEQTASARRGVKVAVGVVVAFLLLPLLLPWGDNSYIGLALWLAILVVGYVVAIVATVRRSTRSFGQGMLKGMALLTLVLLLGVALFSTILDAHTG